MQRLALALVITAAVLATGLTKIADLDFWWHLRTGQLIVSNHAVPRTDVYSYTAFGREYIDHEWLFQVIQYATYATFGPAGIALLKCLIIAATLIIVAVYAMSRGVAPILAGGMAFLSIAGGITRFIERPELFSTLFAVLTFICCDSYSRSRDWRWLVPLPLICALWSNLHAAVIVGLLIQLFFIRSMPQVIAFGASIAAGCLNPFGYRVFTVPFELTRIIESGVLNNEEWRHPTLVKAPFYFLALAVTAVLLARSRKLANIAVAIFLAYISLKYIRSVGMFSVFVPLLIAEDAAPLSKIWRYALAAVGAISLAVILILYFPFQRGFGEASYFPDGIARFTKQRDLRGHMLNSYGFGGYLIWTLYPERRVFIDGRNEVYLPLLERLKVARADSRAWNALLHDYQIEYALLEYVDDLDRVTTLDAAGRATISFAPMTVTRFPRSRWALVYWDDDGMVFIKRGGINATAGEYDAVFPEGGGYQRSLVQEGVVERARAIAQLQRKIAEDPRCRRARMLLAQIAQNR
ncbi:MAG TPA: hypothetical protein VGS96_15325 [Thermoanaerobaculia bacterium]|nr:hypothetical protein [Thermoanaerobaculia bacterium]